MSFRRATLLVLNYNGKPLLEECLPSVVDAARFGGQRHEVMVIDNASSDGSVEFVREHYPDVKIRRMARNRYLFSYNRIISECETDWVVLLNNDVRVETDFLEPLLDHFGDRRVFAATPMVRSDKPTERFECRRYPILSRGVVNTRPDLSSHGIQLTLFAHGGASALDRRKFLSLGGFDSLYWTCLYEDVDLSYAAWLRGWHIVFEPRSRVFHKGGASLGRGGRQSAKWRRVEERVRTLFVLTNIRDRGMLVRSLSWLGLRAAGAITRADSSRLLAYLDVVLRWPRIVEARRRAEEARRYGDREIFAALRQNRRPSPRRVLSTDVESSSRRSDSGRSPVTGSGADASGLAHGRISLMSSNEARNGGCAICQGKTEVLGEVSGTDGRQYEGCRCSRCRLVAARRNGSPGDKEVDFSALYNADYYAVGLWSSHPLRIALEREVVRAEIDYLESRLQSAGNMLDIGCGDGIHMHLFREAGWQVAGTEVSAEAAALAKARYGLTVFVGPAWAAPYPPATFDYVQLRHVIEHLTDPWPTLHAVHGLLRPGGVVRIDTPTVGFAGRSRAVLTRLARWKRMAMGQRVSPEPLTQMLQPPVHNFLYTTKAMAILLNRTGFEGVELLRTYRGDRRHYPSKYLLSGKRVGPYEALFQCVDAAGAAFGAGDVLVAHAAKPKDDSRGRTDGADGVLQLKGMVE